MVLCPPSLRLKRGSPKLTAPSLPLILSRSEGATMSRRPPVIDWSADFDHLDPRWTENPYPIWDELRQKCPTAHTERFMGAYFATRYEDVRTIAYDTEHFSSRRPVVRETRPPMPKPRASPASLKRTRRSCSPSFLRCR